MTFQKLKHKSFKSSDMLNRSASFLKEMKKRRTVRDFSSLPVQIDLITNAIRAAASAPSGANKQPWHFAVVKNNQIKKEIRIAAEKEERAFYDHRAPEQWLRDLDQFGTDWQKPFLEKAPYLIIVFKKHYVLQNGEKYKNYYVNESVGIASGILLSALHLSGLVTLTHTPAPMGFLEKILNRPKNEKAMLLIPVGYPAKNAQVPKLVKKKFKQVCTVF